MTYEGFINEEMDSRLGGLLAQKKYHLRRIEKEIRNRDVMEGLVARRPFITLAMCKDQVPYLVTVNHVMIRGSGIVYFHCASEGRKTDYLLSNPKVYAQVVEDRGYVRGKCSYNYRTVNLTGRAQKVSSVEEKRLALRLLMKKFEPGLRANDARERFIDEPSFGSVSIYRIDIESMTGKQGIPG